MTAGDPQAPRREESPGSAAPVRPGTPYLVLALSLLLTFAGSFVSFRAAKARDGLRFQNAVQRMQVLIETRLETHIALLRAVNGLFTLEGSVSRGEFRSLLQRLEFPHRYPGIQGIGFSRSLSPAEKDLVVAEIRREVPGFRIWPDHPRPEIHTIVYLEPFTRRNQAALGYDMFTDPVRRAAMERARDTGLPAATGRVTLVQETGPRRQAGFLIYTPVYRQGAPAATREDRRAALLGFVYSPFRTADLLQAILGPGFQPNIAFEVFAGPAADPESLLFRSSPAPPAGFEPRFTTNRRFDLAGFPWTVSYSTLPEFDASSARSHAGALLLVGLLTSALLFLLTRSQVRAEQEIARLYAAERTARSAAEAASRAKDRFMATLSHELRTPLTPVLAVVSSLESRLQAGSAPPDLAESLARVRRNVELEARLIDDLLDLTRISQGKLDLRRGAADLRQILEHAFETCCLHIPAAQRPCFTLDLAPGDHRVWGDAPRLTQVFWNLFKNALKFTPAGGEVRVRTFREDDHLVVEVADTGIGIEPELLPQVFDAFAQGAPHPAGGLGLGLAISKAIVEAHGGALAAASEGRGHGATFSVRLPAGLPPEAEVPAVPQEEAAAPEPVSSPPRHLHILLVEDHADTAEVMAEFLRATGRRVTAAGSVAEALAAAEAACKQGGFDLVLSDIGLPDGTGHELMRELAGRYGLHGIALTGYGMEEDVVKSREAGFRRHLTKPIDIASLEAALREV